MNMTNIYLEVGKKKVAACSLDWSGWCRFGKTEDGALQALLDSAPRYRVIAQRAGLNFEPGDLVVVERVTGDATTEFGAPSIIPDADRQPIDETRAKQGVSLLRAAWAVMDEVIATAPAELRKGPRGGGRDRDKVADHVIGAENSYARKIGVRQKQFSFDDLTALHAQRDAIATALSQASDGSPSIPGGWPIPYALRRIAWHVIDHIWEIEDRWV